MPFERLAPRERSRVLGLQARDAGALVLNLRAQLFELQFATIKLGAQRGCLGAARRRSCGGTRSLLLLLLELDAQLRALGAARGARAQIS